MTSLGNAQLHPESAEFDTGVGEAAHRGDASYQVLWSALKRIAVGYSAYEKTALFSGAGAKAYRLEV
jgi:hypothetical protein